MGYSLITDTGENPGSPKAHRGSSQRDNWDPSHLTYGWSTRVNIFGAQTTRQALGTWTEAQGMLSLHSYPHGTTPPPAQGKRLNMG